MRKIQFNKVIGDVTMTLEGKHPALFLRQLTKHNIPIWHIEKITEEKIQGKVYLHHMQRILDVMDDREYQVTFSNRAGIYHYLKSTLKRKGIIIAIMLSLIILLCLSNVIWKVSITGVTSELEAKLSSKLEGYGLIKGNPLFKVTSVDIIQQEILNDMPELLYVGIKQEGVTFEVIAVEKLVEKEKELLPPQDLIAKKSGIIKRMNVRDGVPVVNINDFIQAGDLLVSGTYEQLTEDSQPKTTSAEGEIYANTWYETEVSGDLSQYYEVLSGDKETTYYLGFGDWKVPIWGFNNADFDNEYEEVNKKPIYFLKWETPIKLTEKQTYEKDIVNETMSLEDFKQAAEEFVSNEIVMKLGKDSKVNKYYILHESSVSGKVKLKLYLSVLENIAKPVPIE